MSILVHLSPVLLVMFMLMVLRRPPVQAAMAGTALVAVLWLAGAADAWQTVTLLAAGRDTAVLFLSTAFVIVPGMAFVILIERLGVNLVLSQWVQSLGLDRTQQVVFIVLGLAPLLESMTGFGVSLIATVPLLLSLFERRVALRIALTGMAIMPWGTLGLATVIGASLAHLDASALASTSALTSSLVFLALGTVALYLAGVRQARALGVLGAFWLLFVSVLYGASRWLGPEVAGVGAGLVVACSVLLWALSRVRRTGHQGEGVRWPRQAWPYLALIACIGALKLLSAVTQWQDHWLVQGAQVTWKPLASPGVALTLVLIGLLLYKRDLRRHELNQNGLLRGLAVRTKRPLLTIFFFLAMSQMMVKAGFLSGLVQTLAGLAPSAVMPLIAGFGALSGYMTGSNVGGNAIFMPAIALLPESSRLLLAAVQNSAAGHAALGSLSIVMLVLGLAKTSPQEEGDLVRFGFGLVCLNTLMVALAALVWMA
ncbi:L-lactate permease [Pseudomonas sp. CF161]|uniref:L-lactate permease n=1 Tax=Pseudomonas sp. CF161 TaxID=911241 RepID=UPI0003553552|nr:L-lactate permease [Pseudomonas sp. CF161]EPL16099.1 putative transporter-like membrane protein [Pseudomonas sp. CF161]